MKALTLTQPHATLVAIRAKPLETRDWHTYHRGELAIHAAKGWTVDDRAICHTEPYLSVLRAWKETLPKAGMLSIISALPHASIVAVVDVVNCFRFTSGSRASIQLRADRGEYPPHAASFGNFAAGRFGLLLENVRMLPEPVPCRGMQGLWNVPADAVALIDDQLHEIEMLAREVPL